MNKDIVVLVDLDDTMTHLVRAWCRWLNHMHGTSVSENDVMRWEIADYFPELTEDEVFEPVHMDSFWECVEPKEDAPKYIKMMIDEGFDVYVCTASSFDTIKSKLDNIIGKYFPFIPWSKIIVTENKKLVNGNILIDDGVHNLEGGSYRKILMSAPHNSSYDAESNGMTRVKTWEEAYSAVHAYASEILREDDNYESY